MRKIGIVMVIIGATFLLVGGYNTASFQAGLDRFVYNSSVKGVK